MTKDTPTPTITGEKVFLRPMEKKDFSNYIQASRDRDLGYTAGFFVPPSRMKLEKRLETNMAENYGKTGYWFTICKLGEDESIGFVSISHLDLINGSTVLSIYLSRKELLGKGYGTDAVNAIVDFGFGQLPLERIYLFVREDNARGRFGRMKRRDLPRKGPCEIQFVLKAKWSMTTLWRSCGRNGWTKSER